MSWSASAIGLKEKALASIDKSLASSQASYEKTNPAEAKDVANARESIASAVATVTTNAVQIEASGSRGGGWANSTFKVTPLQFEV